MGFGSRRRKIGFPAANRVYVSMLSASTLRSKSTFWRHLLIFVDLLSLHANGTYRTYMFAHTCKVRWLRVQKWEFTVPGAKKGSGNSGFGVKKLWKRDSRGENEESTTIPHSGGGRSCCAEAKPKKVRNLFFPVRCPPFCHSPSIGCGGSVVVSCGDVIPAFWHVSCSKGANFFGSACRHPTLPH